MAALAFIALAFGLLLPTQVRAQGIQEGWALTGPTISGSAGSDQALAVAAPVKNGGAVPDIQPPKAAALEKNGRVVQITEPVNHVSGEPPAEGPKNGGVVPADKAAGGLAVEGLKNGGPVPVSEVTKALTAASPTKVLRQCGDRVRAIVNYPSGSSCIRIGATGTVICDDSTSLPLLVNWDNNNSCTLSQSGCGRTAPHSWWVTYSEVELATPPRFQYGDRVRAEVNHPASSTCITIGAMGTVYCDDINDPTLPLLVNWDNNDSCTLSQSGCGRTAPHSWWVPYQAIVKFSPLFYGDRVRASVNNPSSSSCIKAGDTGTVICDDSTSLPLLVNWDDNNSCTLSQSGCGRTAPHSWWVTYSEVELATPPRFQYGDRVRAEVNHPASSTCITIGALGTVYCDDVNDPTLPLLVNWDNNDSCTLSQSGCGRTAPHSWWVPYEAIVKPRESTVLYWRFEQGPANAQMTHVSGVNGVWSADVADSSGNSNALSVWTRDAWGGYAYKTDVASAMIPQTGAANNFSVRNTGGYPSMWNNTLRTWSPWAFTIEAAFKPENGGYRTIVGRDSRGAGTRPGADGNASALYFQIQPDNRVAITFQDVMGYQYSAVSAAGLIQGFDYPTDPFGHTGKWYSMAGVSDGATLSLYLNDVAAGTGYQLVAQTDLTLEGSVNTALTPGLGSGSDWSAGDFSVGRGLYNGGHGDRAYGLIDEVRLSGRALDPTNFLFAVPNRVYILQGPRPTNQVVTLGDPASLRVIAGGVGARLQWRHGGTNLPGATSGTYSIAATTMADSGIYDFVVTNSYSSVTSSVATVSVAPRLQVQVAGANLQLTWSPGATLLEATNINGPWTMNLNTSPYTFAPTRPQTFYRLRYP